MADRRLRPLPGGRRRADPVDRRRLHRHRPLPRLGAGVVRRDDRRRAGHGDHRSPDAADRRDQLHAQRGQGHRRRLHRPGDPLRVGHRGPDPQGVARAPSRAPWSPARRSRTTCWTTCATPRTSSRCSATSSRATTSPTPVTGTRATTAGRCPRTPTSAARSSRRTGCSWTTRLIEGSDEKFALTSVYVPYQKNNLASFVSVNSDAASDEYGDMSVLQLPNEQTPGPALVANQFSSDQDVADALAQFNRSGARVLRGNLLTLPVNDGLMYVQPVYALRELSDASFPILRYVLTKYGDNIGLGTTLRDSLEDLIRSSGRHPRHQRHRQRRQGRPGQRRRQREHRPRGPERPRQRADRRPAGAGRGRVRGRRRGARRRRPGLPTRTASPRPRTSSARRSSSRAPVPSEAPSEEPTEDSSGG